MGSGDYGGTLSDFRFLPFKTGYGLGGGVYLNISDYTFLEDSNPLKSSIQNILINELGNMLDKNNDEVLDYLKEYLKEIAENKKKEEN